MNLIAPSLLSADFLNLKADIEMVNRSEANWFHCDVMDGRFVPNITFGPGVAKRAATCGLPVDAHLMVMDPERYVDDFAGAGCRIITVHAEATHHLHRALQQIRAAGCLAGVALNPATSPESLRYVLGDFDLALVMTVNPGFGGQKLIPGCVQKIAALRRMLDDAGCDAIIEVDGGVNTQTAPMLVRAGATMLVAGSALFGAADARAFIDAVKASNGD
jgi:ribulose-phosphate 3-epimerase